MSSLVIDVETDYAEFLHPKNPKVKCYIVGVWSNQQSFVTPMDKLGRLQSVIDQHDTIVGHNLKFDISWLQRYGITFSPEHKFYDTQTAEYILTGQKHTMASLNELALKYTGQTKIDTVKEDYWDKGLPTSDVPEDLLADYCIMDCKLTWDIYQAQLKALPPAMRPLMKSVMEDYRVIQEMEMEGLTFDWQQAKDMESTIKTELWDLYQQINDKHGLGDWFNFSSTHHISALLYGGTVEEIRSEPVGHYKTGKKAGQVKYGKKSIIHDFPRLYTPAKGTESAAEGIYSTSADILELLAKKDKKGLITALSRIRVLEKEVNTYFTGLLKRTEDFNWPKDKIYGRFNTNTTITGRLSSSQPNQQNFSVGAQRLFRSKYVS